MMSDLYADPPVGWVPDPSPTVKVVPLSATQSPEVIAMRPDVTKVQIIALVQAVIGCLAAFGMDLTQEQRDALLEVVKQLGTALILGDAALRIGRNMSDRSPIKP